MLKGNASLSAFAVVFCTIESVSQLAARYLTIPVALRVTPSPHSLGRNDATLCSADRMRTAASATPLCCSILRVARDPTLG